MKKCLNCGVEFQQKYNNEKFCSEECKKQFYISQNDNISKCLVCGGELTIKQLFHKRKACCQKCGHRLAIQNRDPEKVERWVCLMQEKQKESKTIRIKQSAKIT